MKNRRLLITGLAGFTGLVFSGIYFSQNQEEAKYTPDNQVTESPEGMMEYLHVRRMNPQTGEISSFDIENARQQLDQIESSSTLNLQWEELGPDNFGGRSRGFLIDKDNSNIVYATSVSGGIWKSTNAGQTWNVLDDQLDNLAAGPITQASNGDLYVGTGEGMFYFTSGLGSQGIAGNGIYKSTDAGATWTQLSSTTPSGAFTEWAAVGDLKAYPSKPNRIYAGNYAGLRMSEDGGTTWVNAGGGSVTGTCTSIDVDSDGGVWAAIGGRIYYSSNGDAGTFTAKNGTDVPSNGSGRVGIAVSPSNPDIVYTALVQSGQLRGVYRSTDRGTSWTKIGEHTTYFDPMCNTQIPGAGSSCSGGFVFLLGVDPADPNHIFLGGIEIYEWSTSIGWRAVNSQFQSPGNPFYIHADAHSITWDPKNANICYVTSDGGVFKSNDGGFTWTHMNKGFNTMQFYQISLGKDQTVLGGTQDNSNHYINYKGNTSKSSVELNSGDGGYAELSWLDDDALFLESQYGNMRRADFTTLTYQNIFNARMYVNGQPGNSSFAPFVMPFHLHETTEDLLSIDSSQFINEGALKSLGFGDGAKKNFSDILVKPQSSGMFVPESFMIRAGKDTIVSDASGTLSGGGTGTFNAATGAFSVEFNDAPFAEIFVTSDIQYAVNDSLIIESNTNEHKITTVLSAPLNPGDSIKIQDPIQSMFFVGLNSSAAGGGLWMTREALDFEKSGNDVEWWNLHVFRDGEVVTGFDSERAGDILYVSTRTNSNTYVYRVSNLTAARTESTGSKDSTATFAVDVQQIFSTSSGLSTGISVDPNNSDRVIVTLGGYGGAATKVYMSSNATQATPTFQLKQGNLPNMPVYCATFDVTNSNTVLLGTDFGVFATDDIEAAAPSWTSENVNGFANVPVFFIEQYRSWYGNSATDSIQHGEVYVGTHGRGIFRTGSLAAKAPLSQEENGEIAEMVSEEKLTLFPNPATDFVSSVITLNSPSTIEVEVLDLQGKVVYNKTFTNTTTGENKIKVPVSELNSGIYIVSVQANGKVKTGKLLVR